MEGMSKEAIAARREYQKKWREKNPDKVRENNARYWERRAARLAAEREMNNGNEGKAGS